MRPHLRISFSLAAMLALGSSPAAAETPAELPGGNSDAFRNRMMNWSVRREAPAAAPVQRASTEAAAAEVRLPRLSSGYGRRFDPIRGGTRMHAGIDIPGPLGTPVFASGAGLVSFAGPAGGYGLMVEIEHGRQFDTRYGHLSRILVKPGAAVSRGQIIGLMGSTGRSTGSHLHFEVRLGGQPTNPLPLLTSDAQDGRFIPRVGGIELASLAPAERHVSRYARGRELVAESGGERK